MGSESLFKKCLNCRELISKSSDVCKHCGKKTKNYNLFIVLLIFTVIGVLFQISDSFNKYENEVSFDKNSEIALYKQYEKEVFDNIDLESNIELKSYILAVGSFTIHNKSTHIIKDIEVSCSYYARSGTKIDVVKKTIYDIVNKESSETFKNVNMGFMNENAYNYVCKVNRFKIIKGEV